MLLASASEQSVQHYNENAHVIEQRVGILPHRAADLGHRFHADDPFECEVGYIIVSLVVRSDPALHFRTERRGVSEYELVLRGQSVLNQIVCPALR